MLNRGETSWPLETFSRGDFAVVARSSLLRYLGEFMVLGKH